MTSKCTHDYRIFNDNSLKGLNILSFYCRKCLKLVSKVKDYEKEKSK